MYDAEHQACGVLLATSLEAAMVMFIIGNKKTPLHESFRAL